MSTHELLRALEGVVGPANETIDVDELLALHEREALDRAQSVPQQYGSHLRVFGVSLHIVSLYACTTAILGGHQHDLPIVVFACIEELYRTGIHQKGLFHDPPDHEIQLELISKFDTPRRDAACTTDTDATVLMFDRDINLDSETMPNICALLVTYISSLPEPVLCPVVFEAFWSWCVKPSIRRDILDDDHDKPIRPKGTNSGPHKNDAEREEIYIARILFLLLPSANFSLLLYLFSFFTQIPLYPQNGVDFEDLARTFAYDLLGGSSVTIARRMMVWILRRWTQIVTGMQIPERRWDGPESADPRKGTLQSSKSTDESGGFRSAPPDSMDQASDLPNKIGNPMSLQARSDPARSEKAIGKMKVTESLPEYPFPVQDQGLPAISESGETESLYSSGALDERLIDMTPPYENGFVTVTEKDDTLDAVEDTSRCFRAFGERLGQRGMAAENDDWEDLGARRGESSQRKKVGNLDGAGPVVKNEEQEHEDIAALKQRLFEVELERDKALRLLKGVRALVGTFD